MKFYHIVSTTLIAAVPFAAAAPTLGTQQWLKTILNPLPPNASSRIQEDAHVQPSRLPSQQPSATRDYPIANQSPIDGLDSTGQRPVHAPYNFQEQGRNLQVPNDPPLNPSTTQMQDLRHYVSPQHTEHSDNSRSNPVAHRETKQLRWAGLWQPKTHPVGTSYPCPHPQCDEIFPVEHKMLTHQRKVHSGYACTGCGKIFAENRFLIRHHRLNRCKGTLATACSLDPATTQQYDPQPDTSPDGHPIPDETLSVQPPPTQRRQQKTPSSGFQCDLCGDYLSQKHTLRGHKAQIHLNDAAFFCPESECRKGFGTKPRLHSHQRSNHGGFLCITCNHHYATLRSLARHRNLERCTRTAVSCPPDSTSSEQHSPPLPADHLPNLTPTSQSQMRDDSYLHRSLSRHRFRPY